MRQPSTIILTALLTATAHARPADTFPPAWRGQPGSTSQAWEFFSPTLPAAPDLFSANTYGSPVVSAANTGPGDPAWQPSFLTQVGIFSIFNSSLVFEIPNNPPLNPYKDIRVQITWGGFASAPQYDNLNAPSISIASASTPLTNVVSMGDGMQRGDLTGEFHFTHSYFDFRIFPNPASETITISSNLNFQGFDMIDSVVIDTICLPAPAPIVPGTAITAACMLRRRRKVG